MTVVGELDDEEAQWLGRILESPELPVRALVPEDVLERLVDRGLLRWIGPNLVITSQGIEVLVHYRRRR